MCVMVASICFGCSNSLLGPSRSAVRLSVCNWWSSCMWFLPVGSGSPWVPFDDLSFFWGSFDANGELGVSCDEESVSAWA